MKSSSRLSAALMVLLAVSCRYKDLCYDHNHGGILEVGYVWGREAGARNEVRAMNLYVYDVYNSRHQIYSLPGADGGKVKAMPSLYRVLSWNAETPSILWREEDREEGPFAFTRSSSLTEGLQIPGWSLENENAKSSAMGIMLPPDRLWVGDGSLVSIDNGNRNVLIAPQRITSTITVRINNVHNLKYSGSLGASIGPLPASVRMRDGMAGREMANEVFTLQAKGESTLEGSVECFGHETGPLTLCVYALLADRSQWTWSTRVEIQETGPHDIYVEINELTLPKPIVNGSGFKPEVDGWQSVCVEIGM